MEEKYIFQQLSDDNWVFQAERDDLQGLNGEKICSRYYMDPSQIFDPWRSDTTKVQQLVL